MTPSATTTILQTDRLTLRTWSADDAGRAFAIYGDPQVMRFIGSGRPDGAVDDTLRRIQRGIDHQARHGMCLWAVEETATGGLVGACGLKYLDDGPEIEVGYHLARAAWGRGYATEAARTAVQYGFERLGIERIVGVTHPANHASRRVLEKCGLRYCGMAFFYRMVVTYYVAERGTSG